MVPNLDFIRTMLNGVMKSLLACIGNTKSVLERKIAEVDEKIQTPDFAAEEGQSGFIKNKPTLVGRPGTGENAEVFNIKENIASGSYSHAEGYATTASAYYSHAEGFKTEASDGYSHAEGYSTTAGGSATHAEGYGSKTSGVASHAEGSNTTASGSSSHAEGNQTTASGSGSHAEGYSTKATSEDCHAEGRGTRATASCQHVQGKYNIEDPNYAHIVGNGNSAIERSNAHTLDWDGNAWFAGDVYVGSTSDTNKNEGSKKLATEEYVDNAVTNGGSSGGSGVGAAGTGQNAEVFNGVPAENATGDYSHAEGSYTIASNDFAHAEGQETTASGRASHAEGDLTVASGMYAHAEGYNTIASHVDSHAEGYQTVASGAHTHAEGCGTIAASSSQHVQGEYNIEDAVYKYAHIVGNGSSDTDRSNAHTLDWQGNAWFAGSVEGTALILKSPSGKRFRIIVDDSGTLQSAEVTG